MTTTNTTARTATAFDKPFGENIVDASDSLYRAGKELNEAISSLEIARNQARTDESVRAIDLAKKSLIESLNRIEKLKLFDSEFSKLAELYDDDRQEITTA